jgi:hypothetical protein
VTDSGLRSGFTVVTARLEHEVVEASGARQGEVRRVQMRRVYNDLASRVSAAYYLLLEKIDNSTRCTWQPSEHPMENFDRLQAMLVEIESAGDRGAG